MPASAAIPMDADDHLVAAAFFAPPPGSSSDRSTTTIAAVATARGVVRVVDFVQGITLHSAGNATLAFPRVSVDGPASTALFADITSIAVINNSFVVIADSAAAPQLRLWDLNGGTVTTATQSGVLAFAGRVTLAASDWRSDVWIASANRSCVLAANLVLVRDAKGLLRPDLTAPRAVAGACGVTATAALSDVVPATAALGADVGPVAGTPDGRSVVIANAAFQQLLAVTENQTARPMAAFTFGAVKAIDAASVSGALVSLSHDECRLRRVYTAATGGAATFQSGVLSSDQTVLPATACALGALAIRMDDPSSIAETGAAFILPNALGATNLSAVAYRFKNCAARGSSGSGFFQNLTLLIAIIIVLLVAASIGVAALVRRFRNQAKWAAEDQDANPVVAQVNARKREGGRKKAVTVMPDAIVGGVSMYRQRDGTLGPHPDVAPPRAATSLEV